MAIECSSCGAGSFTDKKCNYCGRIDSLGEVEVWIPPNIEVGSYLREKGVMVSTGYHGRDTETVLKEDSRLYLWEACKDYILEPKPGFINWLRQEYTRVEVDGIEAWTILEFEKKKISLRVDRGHLEKAEGVAQMISELGYKVKITVKSSD